MYCSGNITKIKFNYVDLALERIQGELQTLNSDIATISGPFYDQTRFVNSREATSDLEEDIDYMTSELPVLKTFILPGGNMLSSQLHLCRTATRTAEAAINWPFTVEGSDIYVLKSNKAYINRLSDFFFTMARYVNLKDDVTIRLPKTRYNHVACCTIAVAIGIFTIISTW
jgi:cob(I)alamin adenosyltransferase